MPAQGASGEALASAEQAASAEIVGLSEVLPPSQAGRKIIKNGEMTLLWKTRIVRLAG